MTTSLHPAERAFSFLCSLYRHETHVDLADFLCDGATATRLAGHEAVRRREVLLVVQRDNETQVALYLDPLAIAELHASSAVFSFECASESALVVEGASHLLYLLTRDAHDEPVSELELELQAEIDKYAAALLGGDGAEFLLEGNGIGLFRAHQRSASIRNYLFENMLFLDAEDSENGARYRDTHRLAARYTMALEKRFVGRGNQALEHELRRFHGMNQRQKLERIASL